MINKKYKLIKNRYSILLLAFILFFATPIFSQQCANDTAQYSAYGCDSVIWTCSGGAIISKTPTTVIVVWDSVGASGYGKISAGSVGCGTCDFPATVSIPVVIPNVPISGPSTICTYTPYNFSIPLWPGGHYNWHIHVGSPNPHLSLLSQTNGYQIQLEADTTGQFTLQVFYSDSIAGCSDSSLTLIVNVANPVRDSAYPTVGCTGSPATFTLSGGATGIWQITPPFGATYVPSGGLQNSITYTPDTPGTYIVSVNSPSACINQPLFYQVNAVPHVSDTIIKGPDSVCRNIPYTYMAAIPAPTGTQYTWSLPNSADGTFVGGNTGNSVVVKWTAETTATLAISAQSTTGSACVDTATVYLTVHILHPNPAFSYIDTVCANSIDSIHFAAASHDQDFYTWSFTPSNLASCVSGYEHSIRTQIQFNNVTVTTPVTVTLTTTRCDSAATDSQVVYILPVPAVTVTAPAHVCTQDTATFTATSSMTNPAATYLWVFSDGTEISTGTSSSLSYVFSHSGQYWVHVVAHFSTTCVETVISPNDTFTVHSSPVIAMTTAGCYTSGSSVTLGFSPTTYFDSATWVLNGNIVSTGDSTISVSTTGYYTVGVTDSGCTGYASVWVDSCGAGGTGGPCVVTFSSPDSTVYCNDSVVVSINYNFNGYSYVSSTWSLYYSPYIVSGPVAISTGTGTGTNTASAYFTVDHSGYYSIVFSLVVAQGTDTSYCSYTFRNIPVPLHVAWSSTYACSADTGYSLVLSDHSDYIGVAPTYSWAVSPAIQGQTSFSGPEVTTGAVVLGQVYTVTYMVTQGSRVCTYTFMDTAPASLPSAAFYYVDTPLAAGTNKHLICEGFSIRLQPALPYNPLWTYYWYDNHDFASIIEYNPPKEYSWAQIASTNLDKNITLTVTDIYGCSTSHSDTNFLVMENQIVGNVGPSLLLINPGIQYICPSGNIPITFDYETPSGFSPFYWNWYNQIDPSIVRGTLDTFPPPLVSARYLCVVSDTNGCKDISSPGGVVQVLPMSGAAISGGTAYCQGDSILLSTAQVAGATYSWAIADTTFIHIGSYYWHLLLPPGSYTAVLTTTEAFAGTGQTCSATDSFHFTVYAQPSVTASIDSGTIGCSPYSIQLTASAGGAMGSYYWSNDSVGQHTTVYTGGAYGVTFIDSAGCMATASVVVPDVPSIAMQYVPYGCYTYTCISLDSIIENSPAGGIELDGPPATVFASWQWLVNGSPIPGDSGINSMVQPLVVTGPGDYSLVLVSEPGACADTSQPTQISVYPAICGAYCDLGAEVTVTCSDSGNLTISITDVTYAIATYSLFCTVGTFSGLSPSTVYTGANTVTGTFTPDPGFTGSAQMVITLRATTLTGGESCQDTIDFAVPACSSHGHELRKDSSTVTLSLIPNPASDMTTAVYNAGNATGSLYLVVSDIDGQQVWKQSLGSPSGDVTIDVSAMKPDMYFVSLRSGNTNIATTKLIVTDDE